MTLRSFCVSCFADDISGSWGHTTVQDRCFNCGANGGIVSLPEFAVKSIRDQASWIGKRYYPNPEDLEKTAEYRRLMQLVTVFPGRSAVWVKLEDGRECWEVMQKTPTGLVTTFVSADDRLDAFRRSGLTYYTAESLYETKTS